MFVIVLFSLCYSDLFFCFFRRNDVLIFCYFCFAVFLLWHFYRLRDLFDIDVWFVLCLVFMGIIVWVCASPLLFLALFSFFSMQNIDGYCFCWFPPTHQTMCILAPPFPTAPIFTPLHTTLPIRTHRTHLHPYLPIRILFLGDKLVFLCFCWFSPTPQSMCILVLLAPHTAFDCSSAPVHPH